MVPWEFIVLAAVIVLVLVAIFVFKRLITLAINSAIGFFALFAAKIFLPELVINWVSVLITAIGGIIGFIAVLIMHLTGIAF